MSARPHGLWVAEASDRAAFAAAATAFLMRDEARHHLQLAVLADAVRGRYAAAHLVASNRLYLRIGHTPVGEAAEMGFEAPEG
ncbi:MAG: hypothetical protein P1P87_15965 [Trueperaceae bacterium]|nr:hypothetical protein [Trueperaceae bacterium]